MEAQKLRKEHHKAMKAGKSFAIMVGGRQPTTEEEREADYLVVNGKLVKDRDGLAPRTWKEVKTAMRGKLHIVKG